MLGMRWVFHRCGLLAGLAVVLVVGTASGADQLVVFTDHSSVWASSASRSGANVTYTEKGTSTAETVPASTVSAVVPRAVRGQKYDKASIEAVVEKLKSLEKQHVLIKKQLTTLRYEWASHLSVDPKVGQKIDQVLTTFKSGPKNLDTYKKAMFSIQMMQYKDASGAFEAKVQTTVFELTELDAQKRIT